MSSTLFPHLNNNLGDFADVRIIPKIDPVNFTVMEAGFPLRAFSLGLLSSLEAWLYCT